MFFSKIVASKWKVVPYLRYGMFFTCFLLFVTGIITCIPKFGHLGIGIFALVLIPPILLLEMPWKSFVGLAGIKYAYENLYVRAAVYAISCIPCFFSKLTVLAAVALLICALIWAFAQFKAEKPPEPITFRELCGRKEQSNEEQEHDDNTDDQT